MIRTPQSKEYSAAPRKTSWIRAASAHPCAFENGGRLFVTYSGTLTARAGKPHRLAGQFVITGGTGRFFGATGGGVLFGHEDISQVVSGHGEVEALGTIVY